MPIVNIKLIPEKIPAEKKAQLIAGVTKVMQEVLGKDPEKTFVVIEEVSPENWGIGGESLAKRLAGK